MSSPRSPSPSTPSTGVGAIPLGAATPAGAAQHGAQCRCAACGAYRAPPRVYGYAPSPTWAFPPNYASYAPSPPMLRPAPREGPLFVPANDASPSKLHQLSSVACFLAAQRDFEHPYRSVLRDGAGAKDRPAGFIARTSPTTVMAAHYPASGTCRLLLACCARRP